MLLAKRGASGKDNLLLKHYTRDHSFKTMYLMAAVDVNPEEYQTSGSSLFNRTPHSTEHVLAKIVMYQESDIIEMRPGFNPMEVNDKTGEKLMMKYHFISPKGNIFEYYFENAGLYDEYQEKKLLAIEKEREEEKIMEMMSRVSSSLVGIPASPEDLRMRAFIEIMYAQNFGTESEQLYVQYELVLPGNWSYGPLMSEKDQVAYKFGCTQTSRVKSEEIVDLGLGKIVTGVKDKANFCFPLEFDLYRSGSEVGTDGQWPQIIFTVNSRDSWERHTTVGYGYFTLPNTPGSKTVSINTWKPQGSVRQQMSDWFVGGSRMLDHANYVTVPSEAYGKNFLNKYAFNATSSGSLVLRVNTIQLSKSIIPVAAGSDTNADGSKTRSLTDIMNSVGASSFRGASSMRALSMTSGSSSDKLSLSKLRSGLPPLSGGTPSRDRDTPSRRRRDREESE